ncbi:MAG: response regulator [Desulfobacteraceae bacterium]|nr:response regulator [Desulfobacteraceae bacterium]
MSRILIADDVEENRYMLQMLLTGHGHEVLVARNGAEALGMARAGKPDLILSDVLMPQMDGFELCRQCKCDDDLAGVPFVFYTATYTDPKDRDFGLSLGADRYLVKPLEPDCLMRLIREILDLDRGGVREPGGDVEEADYLRSHNEALIRKLEAKMAQLEEANGRLRQEVEERRQAETRLQRLHAAMENAVECVVISDVFGTVEYVNPAFEKSTGFSRYEMTGRSAGRGESAGEEEEFLRRLWNVSRTGGAERGQLQYSRADGQRIEFETVVSPIFDADGELTGYVSILRDITEKRKMEEQLRQAQKMEAIGTLAGGIAHDFNNILSIIFGYVDLLSAEVDEGSDAWQNLRAVLTACDRARNLVGQILTFSRKAERMLVPTDLCMLLKEDAKLLRAALPSTIQIRMRLGTPEEAMVLGDPVQLHQMILNLATNALHSMRQRGGLLEVALREVEVGEQEAQRHPDLAAGRFWLLAVSDTGTGMDEATAARIFEPFFTTKTPGEGTGLGLSVVHGIVQGHGGAIAVDSEVGRGSTFSVYLPVAETEGLPAWENDRASLPGGSERILFVDDEVRVADVGERMLRRFGYQVTTDLSGVAALETFRANPFAFDLVITDQTMPYLTGRDLAVEILGIRPDLPIILCTGFSPDVQEEEAVPGIRKVLIKPLSMKRLVLAVREVLDEQARKASRGRPGEADR